MGSKTLRRSAFAGLFYLLSASYQAAAVPQHFELYGAKTAEHLKLFKTWGFDQVILESNDLIPTANALGMRVVQANWWNPRTEIAQIRAQVEKAKSARHLVSVNMMDEPIYNDPLLYPPDYFVQLRSELEPFQIPLSLTQYGPKEEWTDEETALFKAYLHAVDVIRIDPYPVVANRPLRTVYDWVRRTLQMIEQDVGRAIPLTVILQAWAEGHDDSGRPLLPTPEQLRVMMYLAFFSGADTISFYNFDLALWDQAPGFQEALLSYIRELKTLQKILVDQDVVAGFENQAIFRARARAKHSEEEYCLRINTSYEAQSGIPALGFSSCTHSTSN